MIKIFEEAGLADVQGPIMQKRGPANTVAMHFLVKTGESLDKDENFIDMGDCQAWIEVVQYQRRSYMRDVVSRNPIERVSQKPKPQKPAKKAEAAPKAKDDEQTPASARQPAAKRALTPAKTEQTVQAVLSTQEEEDAAEEAIADKANAEKTIASAQGDATGSAAKKPKMQKPYTDKTPTGIEFVKTRDSGECLFDTAAIALGRESKTHEALWGQEGEPHDCQKNDCQT